MTMGSILLMICNSLRMVSFFRAGGTHPMVPSIRSFSCSVKCRVYGPHCFAALFMVVTLKFFITFITGDGVELEKEVYTH